MTGGAIDDHAHALGVRRPDAAGTALGMAHVIAGHQALFANLAVLAHGTYLLTVATSIVALFRALCKLFLKFILNYSRNSI